MSDYDSFKGWLALNITTEKADGTTATVPVAILMDLTAAGAKRPVAAIARIVVSTKGAHPPAVVLPASARVVKRQFWKTDSEFLLLPLARSFL